MQFFMSLLSLIDQSQHMHCFGYYINNSKQKASLWAAVPVLVICPFCNAMGKAGLTL